LGLRLELVLKGNPFGSVSIAGQPQCAGIVSECATIQELSHGGSNRNTDEISKVFAQCRPQVLSPEIFLSFAKTLSAFEISGIEIALDRGFEISATHVPSHSDRFHINSSPLPHASQPVA